VPERKSKAELERSVMAIPLDDDMKIGKPEPDARKTLSIDDLVPFAGHPFKLYEGERLDDMVRSVREYGVIVPIIVRPHTGDEYAGMYEILSGHNRVNAARIAGLGETPAVIKKGLTDNEAKLIVTETNLMQRSFADLSHSERAVALKTHMDAIKSQGKRNDLLDEIKILSNPREIGENGTSYQVDTMLRSNEKTGAQYGLSSASVARYVRLTFLNQALLDRVDSNEIPFLPAVSLSYLSPDEQTELNRLLDESAYKVDMKKAESLREFSEGKKLTPDKMIQILSGELNKKPKPKTAPAFKLKAKIYQKYFNGDTPQSEMETVIDQALAEYFENHERKEVTA
jgi:ParB family chromosome partitioning protein